MALDRTQLGRPADPAHGPSNRAARAMARLGHSFRGRLRGRLGLPGLMRDDAGAVTIEFTVLVPFFVLLLVFFADASVVYLTHSEMYANARDLARRMSVETLTTPDQVRDYAADHLFLGNRTYTVSPEFGANMSVTISVPIAEAAITGFFLTPIIGRTLSASATMRREPLL